MSKWLPYPTQRPMPSQTYDEFLVAYANPRYVNKSFFSNGAPKYCQAVMTWNGGDWLNLDHHKITHFQPLPNSPED